MMLRLTTYTLSAVGAEPRMPRPVGGKTYPPPFFGTEVMPGLPSPSASSVFNPAPEAGHAPCASLSVTPISAVHPYSTRLAIPLPDCLPAQSAAPMDGASHTASGRSVSIVVPPVTICPAALSCAGGITVLQPRVVPTSLSPSTLNFTSAKTSMSAAPATAALVAGHEDFSRNRTASVHVVSPEHPSLLVVTPVMSLAPELPPSAKESVWVAA